MTAWRTRGHRGDALEDILLLTNDYYRQHQYGLVDKASTPIKVVEIDQSGLITKGYFEKKSTVDFIGVVQGHAVAFDAKETNLKNLPLYNIHDHQLEYMKAFDHQGGLAFLIVHFTTPDRFFLVPYEILDEYFAKAAEGGRKSIPFTAMARCHEIVRTYNGLLNYLPALDEYLKAKRASD